MQSFLNKILKVNKNIEIDVHKDSTFLLKPTKVFAAVGIQLPALWLPETSSYWTFTHLLTEWL